MTTRCGSAFARRHYEAIADVFAAQRPGDNWDANKRVQHNLLLRDMVETLRRDNAAFKAERFVKRAGGWAHEEGNGHGT